MGCNTGIFTVVVVSKSGEKNIEGQAGGLRMVSFYFAGMFYMFDYNCPDDYIRFSWISGFFTVYLLSPDRRSGWDMKHQE